MPKYGRTANTSNLIIDDEEDPYRLIEEEEEEEEPEEEDEDTDGDDAADEADEDEDEDEPEEDEDADEDEPEEEDGEDPDEDTRTVPTKKARAQARIRQLNTIARKAREEAAAARAELAAHTQQRQQTTGQRSAAEEAAYRASLPPEDLIRYDVNNVLRTQNQQMQLLQFNMQDTADKQAYTAQAATNPVYEKYAAKVERKLLELRKQGMNVPRSAILQNIIGEAVLSGKGKTVSRVKAKENEKKQKTKATSGRSDTSRTSPRGANNEREARKRRLENVTF